jgi:hypothetical protein
MMVKANGSLLFKVTILFKKMLMLCEKRFERQNEKRCEVGDIKSVQSNL